MAQNQDRPKTAQQQKEQEYRQHVEQVTPKYSLPVRMVKAFVTGGIICLLGQFILNYATNTMGLDKETAGSWCSMLLVLLSVLLTGWNIYPKLVEWGGGGALAPIRWLRRRSSTRRKVRYSGSGVRSLPSRVR